MHLRFVRPCSIFHSTQPLEEGANEKPQNQQQPPLQRQQQQQQQRRSSRFSQPPSVRSSFRHETSARPDAVAQAMKVF